MDKWHLGVHRPSLRPDRFEICDALGRRVSAGETVAGYPLRIELASLASGAYVFRTSAGTGRFVVLDSRAMRLLFSWVLLHCAASGFAQWVPAGVPFRIFEMGNIHKDTITDALYFCGESSLNNDFDVSMVRCRYTPMANGIRWACSEGACRLLRAGMTP